MREIRLTLHDVLPDERLDKALSDAVEELSRTAAARLIRDGQVTADDQVIQKPSFPVADGMVLCAVLPEPENPEILPADIPLDILYEDAEVLVINKPKGMVVHPAAGHRDDTLVNAVMAHCKDSLSGIGGVLRPGIVHRIDKDTTGALIVCKSDRAHLSLAAQLKEHALEREYVALVHGILREDVTRYDLPIARSKKDRKRMATDPAGKPAVTHVRVLRRFPEDRVTWVACRLETGRTHQIRVHLTQAGHSLLGDTVYTSGRTPEAKRLEKTLEKRTGASLQGQCLHARTVGFTHPVSGRQIRCEAPLPPYFVALLDKLV